ncbi:MAG: hypothetical protein KBA26_00620 [Candidatus Delongbacteria bacterium]|nr:hypothetical protein [Candidatus Delongbacteria bacterium]
MIHKAINFLESDGSIRNQKAQSRSGWLSIILFIIIGLLFLTGIGLILTYFGILSIPWIDHTVIPWIHQWIII